MSYNSHSFLTSALDGSEWSASRPGRALPPGKEPPVPTVQEAGWAPEPVWTQRLEKKSSASVGDPTPAVQSVVRHCTAWATLFSYKIQNIFAFSRWLGEDVSVCLRGCDAVVYTHNGMQEEPINLCSTLKVKDQISKQHNTTDGIKGLIDLWIFNLCFKSQTRFY
jgi:hypothetical protein